MENLIYQKIKEYDIKMNSFTISFTGRPLLIDDLISCIDSEMQ